MESKEMMAVHKESLIGVVSNCKNLNIRREPDMNAEVLGIIPVDTEVMIDENESISEFYKIYTTFGLEGFCMKKFVTI